MVPICNRIKTFEDALQEVEKTIPDIREQYESIKATKTVFSARFEAEFQLMVIVIALNEGWVPDWSNWDEWKYYPYFFVGGSAHFGAYAGVGCVFSYHAASITTRASFGSRLCFSSRDKAEYAGNQFLEIYNQLLLG